VPAVAAQAGPPEILVNAAGHYSSRSDAQDETLDGIALFALPSTSGQAVRYFDIGPWRAAARFAFGAAA